LNFSFIIERGIMLKHKYEVVLVIPARFNSTRLPGKPLIDINGKPLLQRVYDNAKLVQDVDRIIVATEDQRIVNYCNENGIQSIMTSLNHNTMISRVAEVSKYIKADYFLILNGDEPLLEPENINKILCGLNKSKSSKFLVRNLISPIDIKNHLDDGTDLMVAVNNRNQIIYISRAYIPKFNGNNAKSYYKHLGCYLLTRTSLEFFINVDKGFLESSEDIDLLRYIENYKRVEAVVVNSKSTSVDLNDDVKIISEILKS